MIFVRKLTLNKYAANVNEYSLTITIDQYQQWKQKLQNGELVGSVWWRAAKKNKLWIRALSKGTAS